MAEGVVDRNVTSQSWDVSVMGNLHVRGSTLLLRISCHLSRSVTRYMPCNLSLEKLFKK